MHRRVPRHLPLNTIYLCSKYSRTLLSREDPGIGDPLETFAPAARYSRMTRCTVSTITLARNGFSVKALHLTPGMVGASGGVQPSRKLKSKGMDRRLFIGVCPSYLPFPGQVCVTRETVKRTAGRQKLTSVRKERSYA